MAASTENRNTLELACNSMNCHRVFTVKTATTIHAGTIVAVDSTGYALPAADSAGLVVVGLAQHYAEAGEKVTVKSGVFSFDNAAAPNACSNSSHLNNLIYVADDHTVSTSAGSHSVKAGVMRYVDDAGSVWAEIGNIRTT
jgi:hypothetical protein